MSEEVGRDEGIARAARAADNHYEEILRYANLYLIRFVIPGQTVVSGQIFKHAIENRPHIHPREKRVMGAVMQTLERKGMIIKAGTSTRERSHKGSATEWKRTRVI